MGATTLITESGRRNRGQLAGLAPSALLVIGFTLAATTKALAHDPGLSSIDVRVEQHRIVLMLSLAPADAQALGGRDTVGTVAPDLIDVRLDDRRLSGFVESTAIDEVSSVVQARLVYAGAPGSRLVVKSEIPARLARGHRELVSIRADDGKLLSERLLDAAWNEAEARLDRSASDASAQIVRFGALGVRHILTGYDHLLFLAGLLVVLRRWRDVVQTITAFTIAHSITLALATIGSVRVPGHMIEPAIAASIVYVGLENLFRRVQCSRGKLTFGFGLIHGFGFASALRDLGIGTSGAAVVLPLASFNAGVELGQIAVAALLVPVFRRLNAQTGLRLQFASAWSLLVVAAGSYWFIQRVV